MNDKAESWARAIASCRGLGLQKLSRYKNREITRDRWFHLSRDQFDALHYAGMGIFKIGIMLFNLVPFVVLSILG